MACESLKERNNRLQDYNERLVAELRHVKKQNQILSNEYSLALTRSEDWKYSNGSYAQPGSQDHTLQGPLDHGHQGPQHHALQGPRDNALQGPRDHAIQGPFNKTLNPSSSVLPRRTLVTMDPSSARMLHAQESLEDLTRVTRHAVPLPVRKASALIKQQLRYEDSPQSPQTRTGDCGGGE